MGISVTWRSPVLSTSRTGAVWKSRQSQEEEEGEDEYGGGGWSWRSPDVVSW